MASYLATKQVDKFCWGFIFESFRRHSYLIETFLIGIAINMKICSGVSYNYLFILDYRYLIISYNFIIQRILVTIIKSF